MPAFFIQLQNIKNISTKHCLEFTSLFFFSFIAYLVLNIITSIFSAHLVGFAIVGELILTGNFSYSYYISYFQNSFTNQGSVHKPWEKQYIPGTFAQSLASLPKMYIS